MNRKIVAFLVLTPILISSCFASFMELYLNNLREDVSFQQQSLKFMSSELGYKQYEDLFQPYVTFGTGKGSGLLFDESGFKSSSLSLTANLLHILGTDFGLSVPFSYVKDRKKQNGDPDDEFKIEKISINISRDLISEEKSDKLLKESAMLSDSFSLNQTAWTVFIDTVSSIFDIRYNRDLLALYKKKSEIFRELADNETDPDKKRNYEKQFLNSEKLRLGVESILVDLGKYDEFEDEYLDKVYGEILMIVPDMYENSVKRDIATRNDVRALSLSMQAAEEKAQLWFLPYIPNPNLTFSPSFNVSDPDLNFEDRFSWSLSVKCDVTLFDRGEMDSESINRQGNAEIKKLEYRQKIDSLEKKLETRHLDERKSMLDYEIKQIDYQLTQESHDRNMQLYKKGYLDESDLELSGIDFSQSKLDYEKSLQALILSKLNIMKEIVDTPGGL